MGKCRSLVNTCVILCRHHRTQGLWSDGPGWLPLSQSHLAHVPCSWLWGKLFSVDTHPHLHPMETFLFLSLFFFSFLVWTYFGGLPDGVNGKEPACQFRIHKRRGFDHGVGRSPGEYWHGNPLQYSCLENPMDRGAWRAAVHGVTKSQTRLRPLSMHAAPWVLVGSCGSFINSCGMWTLNRGMWDLVPPPGVEPRPPAFGAWSLSHWTSREVPWDFYFLKTANLKESSRQRHTLCSGTFCSPPFLRKGPWWQVNSDLSLPQETQGAWVARFGSRPP